jgi:hypothetical protein
MNKEEKKYQDIGFTLRTIYDAIGKGFADLDDLQTMFFKALPDMPKNVLEDVLVLLQKGADTEIIKGIGGFLIPGTASRKRINNVTAAFVAGLTGQDPDTITVDIDQQDIQREADAEYAANIPIESQAERIRRMNERQTVDTSEGVLNAAWEDFKETGDSDKLLELVRKIEVEGVESASVSSPYFARYTGAANLQYYGLEDDLNLVNYREVANNQNQTPLYNYGLASTFLAGLDPAKVIDFQRELMEAGFLQPGSFVPGVIGVVGGGQEDETILALEAAFSYLNTKPEYGIDIDDLKEINIASNGDEGAFLGFMREYFLDSISDISLTDTRPIFTAPNLVAQANPDFLRANVNSAVRETIGANPSIRDYQVIYDFAKTEIERLSAAYTESQKIYEQARVDVAAQQMADAQAGTEQEFYLLPSQMSNQDVSAAFQVGLDEFVFDYFKPLIDQGKQNMAYQQGLGVAIASLTR